MRTDCLKRLSTFRDFKEMTRGYPNLDSNYLLGFVDLEPHTHASPIGQRRVTSRTYA